MWQHGTNDLPCVGPRPTRGDATPQFPGIPSRGVCLVLGPLLLALRAAVDPAWSLDDPARFRAEIAAAPDRFAVAGMLASIAAVVFVVGLVGAMEVLRRRSVDLVQVGCGLIVVGMVFYSAYYAIYIIESASTLPPFDQAQMQTMLERAQYGPYALPFAVAVLGVLPLGHLLLGIGLLARRAVVPSWVAVAVLASFALLLPETQVLSVAGFLVASVGFGWLGLRILRTPDAEWERWQVLPERDADRQPA